MRIELKHISHCFDKRVLFDDINAVVDSGRCLVVSGRSGSGKSLLFSILCGIFKPNQGEVLIDGKAIAQMDNEEYCNFRKYLGAVFQVSALVSNLTLEENLMLPLNQHCSDISCDDKKDQVKCICHEFGLEEYLEQRTDQLSTGLASLAGLARALLINPKCLIWDAPMAEIDLKWIDHVTNRLRRLKQNGTTIIFFTNRARLIEKMADIQLDLTQIGRASCRERVYAPV